MSRASDAQPTKGQTRRCRRNVGHSGLPQLLAFVLVLQGGPPRAQGVRCPPGPSPLALHSYSVLQERDPVGVLDRILRGYAQAGTDIGVRLHNSTLVALEQEGGAYEQAQGLRLLVLEKLQLDRLSAPGVAPFASASVRELRVISCQGVHAWFSGPALLADDPRRALPRLETLQILDSDLVYVSATLGQLGRLRKVTISRSQVAWVYGQAFRDQEDLQWLALDGNSIQQLTRGALPAHARALRHLDLSGNRLTSLSDLDLRSLPNLRALHLSDNRVLRTLADVRSLPHLGELWLQGMPQMECQEFCWLFRLDKSQPLSMGLGWTGAGCTEKDFHQVQLDEGHCPAEADQSVLRARRAFA